MKGAWTKGLLVGALALTLCVGLADAQQRGQDRPRGPAGYGRPTGPGPMGPGMMGPGMMGPGMDRQRGGGLAWLLVEGGDVKATATDSGVRITITTDNADQRERLREGVRQRIQRINRMREGAGAGDRRRRGPQEGGLQGGGPGGLMQLIASGRLQVSARDVDKGIAVTLRSDDPNIVERLQAEVPRLVAAYNERGRAVNPEQMRAANRLLASDKVKIEVKQTEGGITVRIASDDPKVAKQIKELLPAYFEGIGRRARMMERARQMQGGPMQGGPFGQGRPGPGPGGPGGGQRRGPGGGRFQGPLPPLEE